MFKRQATNIECKLFSQCQNYFFHRKVFFFAFILLLLLSIFVGIVIYSTTITPRFSYTDDFSPTLILADKLDYDLQRSYRKLIRISRNSNIEFDRLRISPSYVLYITKPIHIDNPNDLYNTLLSSQSLLKEADPIFVPNNYNTLNQQRSFNSIIEVVVIYNSSTQYYAVASETNVIELVKQALPDATLYDHIQ